MNLCALRVAKDKNPEAVTLPPYFDDEYDDGDCDDEDYWENMALKQEVGRQFGLKEEAEDDTEIAIEEKREIIKEKQEEIYGECGLSTGFGALTAQLNRICHALQLDTGTDEIVVLNRIESLVRYKMKHDGMIEDALPKFNLRPHVEDDGEVLDVAFLRLDEIPDSISELANLTAVYASHNNIINLPDSLCSLSNLIELDVSDNNLTSLPEAFGELTSIMLLFLSNNELASLPPSIVKLSNLEEMDVSGNQLCCLPDNMESLARLKILTIYGNDDLVVPGSMASVEIII